MPLMSQNALVTGMESLSISEKEGIYKTVEELLDLLDSPSLLEITKNVSSKDLGEIFNIILEETHNVINLRKYNSTFNTSSLEALPNLKAGYEEYLRKKNLNYFVHSVLPAFEMNWHCFAKNFEVRMFDGSLKKIQDIQVGDQVMGPDSTPRNVLKLFNGKSEMFTVINTGDVESYTVSREHNILLWDKKGNLYKKKPYEIPQRWKTNTSPWHEKYSQRIVGYDTSNNQIDLNPYFLGLWLGDGDKKDQCISSIDFEIIDFLEDYAKEFGYYVRHSDENCHHWICKTTGHKNKLIQLLKEYNLINNKHLPRFVFSLSKEIRFQILAGFIDADGTYTKENTFVVSGIDRELILSIQELCYSLGLRASFNETNYYSLTVQRNHKMFVSCISGDIWQIPTKVKRKKAVPKKTNRDWRRSNIKEVISQGQGEYFGFECDGDHQFLAKNGMVMSNCIEWFSMLQLYRLLCVIAARDHSKSYSFSFAYILWRLYRYTRPTSLIMPPDEIKYYKEGMLITNEFKLAKRLLKKVKEEIQFNSILKEALYPDKNIGGWANESLTCKTGAEVTLSSFRTSNRGPHPGWIVVDDFLDKSAIYSKEQREKFKEVFFAEVMNMILPQGQVAVVGTPFHEKDLYSDLKVDPSWKVFEYPAVYPDGQTLWTNRYSFEALKAKRLTLGSLIFSREILVRPISDSTSIFPWSILEKAFINMSNVVLVNNRVSYPVRLKKVAVGVDWALSANVGADYTVFCVVGLDELDQIHLLQLKRLHGAGYNEQISHLQMINAAFQPEIILAESNNFQQVMIGLAHQVGLTNVVEETTTAGTKKDLYNGLPSLAILFEQNKFKFPRGDEYSVEVTNALCSELNSIAFDDEKGTLASVSEHDDMAMALFFAVKGLRTMNYTFKVNTV